MEYNPNFLNNTNILSKSEKEEIEKLSSVFSFKDFEKSNRLVEKIGFDFIYSSAQIEGNTYTKADTLALLEDGITANAKLFIQMLR